MRLRKRFLTGDIQEGRSLPDITWHGVKLHEPLWNDPNALVLAFTMAAVLDNEEDVHVMINMSEDSVDMELPGIDGRSWYGAVDTWKTSPGDILEPSDQNWIRENIYPVQPRSIVVFEARPPSS